jgi:CO/xanthine dehydrogenase FAD-binding subunit
MLVVQTHAGRLGSAWHAPESWGEATALLAEYGPDSSVAGGATYLMWRAAHGEPMPPHLISLHRITEQQELAPTCIGALVTLRRLERATGTGVLRALTMAASVTAGPPVRTIATLGGNLASGFCQADLVPALLAMDAEAHCADGNQVSVKQVVDEGTAGRLVTRITHRLTAEKGWSGTSVKLSRRGMDLSVGLASVIVRLRDGAIQEARVAVGSLYDRPCRLPAVEAVLEGTDPDPRALRATLSSTDFGSGRFRTDGEASAAYRAQIAGPLVHRALSVAIRLGADGAPEVGDARL